MAQGDWLNVMVCDDLRGWAVVTGCDGDGPSVHALFVGPQAYDEARRCVDTYAVEHGERMCDPAIVPFRGKALVGMADGERDNINEMWRIVPGWERPRG